MMLPHVLGAVHRSVRTETFQISFTEPFRIVFLGTLLTLEGTCLSAGALEEYWLSLGFIPLMTAALSAASVAFLVWRYKFSVGPEGLACYDFWCRPLTTTWDDMRSAALVRLPGLAYARIITSDRYRAVWLPLFVSDEEGLRELVRLYAGPDHPLTHQLCSLGEPRS
jgi:hypothetical protein